jgi:hypothetical protein
MNIAVERKRDFEFCSIFSRKREPASSTYGRARVSFAARSASPHHNLCVPPVPVRVHRLFYKRLTHKR